MTNLLNVIREQEGEGFDKLAWDWFHPDTKKERKLVRVVDEYYATRYKLSLRNSIISILEEQVEAISNRFAIYDKELKLWWKSATESMGNEEAKGYNQALDEQISSLKEVIKELRG